MKADLIELVYKQYQKEIYFYLLALSHDPCLAQDVLQEVFVKAICSLPDSHENIRAWLYKVAKNTFLNERKKREKTVPLEVSTYEMDVMVDKNSVLYSLLEKEKEKVLMEGIMQLPDLQRNVLILQYYSGLSVKEIAGILKLTLENTRVLSYRARKKVKQYMEVNGYEIS